MNEKSASRYRAAIFVIACVVGALLPGCYSHEVLDVDKVKTDAIHQAYSVIFDGESNKTAAGAAFRVGGETGTTLDLTEKSSVTFNGEPMAAGRFVGRSYTASTPGHSSECKFVFTDSEGVEFVNVASLPRAEFVADTPESLSRREGLTLSFDGPPLGKDELLILEWAPVSEADAGDDAPGQIDLDAAKNDPAAFLEESKKRMAERRKSGGITSDRTELVRTTEAGITSVEIPTEVLSQIETDQIEVRWHRSSNRELQKETSAGGAFTVQYRSSPRTFSLTD